MLQQWEVAIRIDLQLLFQILVGLRVLSEPHFLLEQHNQNVSQNHSVE